MEDPAATVAVSWFCPEVPSLLQATVDAVALRIGSLRKDIIIQLKFEKIYPYYVAHGLWIVTWPTGVLYGVKPLYHFPPFE